MDEAQLSEVFRQFGADDPEDWARSQMQEGIPQLGRFLFLTACWSTINEDGDTAWIDRVLDEVTPDSDEPFAGTAHSIRALLAAGATRGDIAELVRTTQAEMLATFTYVLSDADVLPGNNYVNWALVEVDDGQLIVPPRWLGALHESVLETDPIGREMRPSR
ncbi:MAG: hypothetical protein AAGD18_17435 [Actinomycetota bacterium]